MMTKPCDAMRDRKLRISDTSMPVPGPNMMGACKKPFCPSVCGRMMV